MPQTESAGARRARSPDPIEVNAQPPVVITPATHAAPSVGRAKSQAASHSRRSASSSGVTNSISEQDIEQWDADRFLRVATARLTKALLINVPEAELGAAVDVDLTREDEELSAARVSVSGVSAPLSATATPAPVQSSTMDPPAAPSSGSPSPTEIPIPAAASAAPASPHIIFMTTREAAARAAAAIARAALPLGATEAVARARVLCGRLEDPSAERDTLRSRLRCGAVTARDLLRMNDVALRTKSEQREHDASMVHDVAGKDLVRIRRDGAVTTDEFPCPECNARESVIIEAHDHDTEGRGVWNMDQPEPLTAFECVKCGHSYTKPTGS
jgi:DNA-directed RNA polymerase subunit M/transcription elongation factor TFIIS